MAAPATTGIERTNISDMQIGDYIKAVFNTATYQIRNLGNASTYPEANYNGTSGNNYAFYFIKVEKGLLIADRVMLSNVSWDSLNSQKVIQGKPNAVFSDVGVTIIPGILRSLTGGVAYADANGNKSTTDQGYGGWPTNNEWDKYIVNFPQDKIQEGKTLDDVFHWNGVWTWCQDTPTNEVVASGNNRRVVRSYLTEKKFNWATSDWVTNITGFRPVFEYKEV